MRSIDMTGRSVSEPFRRAGRRAWTVTVRWDGEGYQVALNTRDERKAKMLATALRLKVEAGEWEPPQVQQRGVATSLADAARDYANWYVTAAGEDRVEARRRSWRSDGCQLEALVEWFRARGVESMSEIAHVDALAFVDARRKRGSVETTRRIVRVAKAFWNWAIPRGKAGANPWVSIPFARRAAPDPRNLSDVELARLLAHAEQLRPRSRCVWEFAACGLYAGMRLGEILALQVEDPDASSGLVRVREFKHGAPRDSLYPAELREILAARVSAARKRVTRGGDARLFPEASDGWGRRVANLLASAGIAAATLHDLRRTFAGLLARRGVPLTRIRDYLGHESAATTEGYYVGRAEAVAEDGALLGLGRRRVVRRKPGGDLGAASRKRRGAAS